MKKLTGPELLYFAPSYKRTDLSPTQQLFPFVKLVVAEGEAEAYFEAGNDIIACPDAVQGNLCRVRNWILDNYLDKADCVVLLDDDYRGVYEWNRQEKTELVGDDFAEMCEMATIMARDLGAKLWGLNCVPDKGAYHEHNPFSFLNYIGGPFQAHMKGSTIRYDEDLPLKEDYDITLQHLKRHRKVLRLNKFHYDVKQSEQVGGCADYRTLKKEKEQFELLQKKWGKDIVRQDKKSKKSFDYNPIIKSPIKGV